MGTVKYTGPVASFHCPTEATIRSLKVHFSPKQEGSGDPSPENVREIVGWDGVEVEQRGTNLFDASNPNIISPNCWISSSGDKKITNSNADRTLYIACLPNTTYVISKTIGNVLGAGYTTDFPAINMPTYSYMRDSANARQVTVTTGPDAKYLAVWFYDSSKTYDRTVQPEDIYKTLQIEYGSTATPYKLHHGSTINYEFGVLGKNKYPLTESTTVENIKTGYDNTVVRDVTSTSIYQNVSANNYWIGSTISSYISSIGNGEITFSSSDGSYGAGMFVPVIPNQTYILSCNSEKVRFRVGYFNDDGTFSGQHFIANKAFTIPAEYHYAFIVIVPLADYYNQEITVSNIQLELGSTATTYEPYDSNHTVYGGWVDLITGEVASTYIHCKIKDLPGEWNYRSGNNRFQITLTDDYANAASSGGIWTHFATSEVYATSTSNGYGNKQIATYIDKHIYIRDDDFEGDVEAFLNGVGDTYVTYELAESTTYSLSPTSMQTFLAQNNVWSNANYVEVEYDLHETQTILARKQFIIANQPHIVKPAAAPLQNFVTDIAAPLKECKVYFSPVQEGEGDPSPENVRAITGWTGIEVYRTGKNILPPAQEDGMHKLFVNKGITITASSEMSDGTNDQIRYYKEDGTQIDYWNLVNIFQNSNRHYRAFATLSQTGWFKFVYSGDERQIEFGNRPTTYEPYSGTTLPIDWTTEAGTVYGGYVDLVTGEVWQTWRKANLGDLNWRIFKDVFYNYPNKDAINGTADKKIGITNVICSNYATEDESLKDQWSVSEGKICGWKSSTTHYLYIKDSRYSDTDEFKTAVDGIYAYYELETPILLATLTLTQLKTLRGTNNIWSNAGDIELSYWKH